MSSGEKEILFGYLRLRNSAPKYSVILLDEPELHLNPALVRGLPQFYYKHMGRELENQIWLVTHSDAFLREAIGQEDLQVFHMQHANVSGDTVNQMHELHPGEEVESIILELVGNLATYRPGAKVVILEGESSEFDLHMVSRLFPDIENQVNLVSAGSRSRVETLHQVLDQSVRAGNIPVKIYSIVDRDAGPIIASPDDSRHSSWDVYHIENYLLESKFIDDALGDLNISRNDLSSLVKIDQRLKEIAESQIGTLVTHKVQSDIYSKLLPILNPNPTAEDISTELHRSISQSMKQVNERIDVELDLNAIRKQVTRERDFLSTHWLQKAGESTSEGEISYGSLPGNM